ncbi:MAG: hypothetical protein DWQ40_09145 [Actinobacteria bacterium]|nr:MAG: hypothetical protein DWQ40_09145 [Actinomycetota bacterium]REK38271.1 MAG: hypothetical protein DWQ20_03990 [Actinomycetota bacterium]
MLKPRRPQRVSRVLAGSGYVAIATSLLTLVLGLFMIETGARDFRASFEVTSNAVDAIHETVDVVTEATAEVQAGIDAAASGIAGVSSTATVGASSLENVAGFLENELPDDLEAIRGAMPAAIQAAGAIDGTLRALSFIGVDYSPEEPFDDSLRQVEQALIGLPENLRTQAGSLRDLVPAASELAGEADRLALALDQLGNDLDGIHEITSAYNDTLTEASMTIDRTEATLDRNIWLLRAILFALAVGGAALGLGLVALSRLMSEALELRSYPVAS